MLPIGSAGQRCHARLTRASPFLCELGTVSSCVDNFTDKDGLVLKQQLSPLFQMREQQRQPEERVA